MANQKDVKISLICLSIILILTIRSLARIIVVLTVVQEQDKLNDKQRAL